MIKVSIVEDHTTYGWLLRDIINAMDDFDVVEVYTSAEAALKGIKIQPSAITIIDVRLPGISGIDLIGKLRITNPGMLHLVCSTHHDNQTIFQALKAGASGYLLKDSTNVQIQNAVIELYNGGSPMSPYIARQIVNTFHEPVKILENPLSIRENEIIGLVANGLSYQEIADQLFIHVETVKKHIRNIYTKLQVNNKVMAINKFKQL